MKKVLSALTAIAFAGAYAASLTVGGQVNAGIKVTGGNHGEETKVQYYLDAGDTKIFLKYKDEAKGIEGVLVGAFDGVAVNVNNENEIETVASLFRAKEAWIKFDLFRSGDVGAYMILGLQPNIIKVCDISINGVYGPDGGNYAKTDEAVTLGISLGETKLQATLVDPKGNKGFYSLAEVASVFPTKYADVAVALDMNPGVLGYKQDDRWLAYGYVNIKAIEPVGIEAQAYYGKYTEDDNSTISGVAVKVASKKGFKLISKTAKPYVQVEYVSDNNVRLFAVNAGTKVSYNKHLTENGYIRYIAIKDTTREKTSLEVGGDFTLKFAKSIPLD